MIEFPPFMGPRSREPPPVFNRVKMFPTLDKHLPADLVAIVLCFDGRIYNAYVRDYIEMVYAKCYRQCFGRFTFKRALSRTKTLHYYAALAHAFRSVSSKYVKARKCVRHQKPYAKDIKKYRLVVPFKHILSQHLLSKSRLFGNFYNRVYQ